MRFATSAPSSPAAPRGRADERDAGRFRTAVQDFVRSFGLLGSDQTPCGEPLALSHAHALQVLLELRPGEPITQQALAHALGIDKSNVTRLCAKMERVEHIERLRSPHDGRARPMILTAKGRRVAGRVIAKSRERFTHLLDALPTAPERRAVIEALESLNGALASLGAKGESWTKRA